MLADALWYAQDRFEPEFMINLATLTGAIMVALGNDHAGPVLQQRRAGEPIAEAGLTSGEKLWRMPLGPAYDKLIESQFADMKNTGGRYGGSITAAQFLKRFVNDVPWAHLDIAGTAFGVGKSETNTAGRPASASRCSTGWCGITTRDSQTRRAPRGQTWTRESRTPRDFSRAPPEGQGLT